ncbi:phosphonate C-P lyase system protein PhnH [Hydrogenophaga sp. BPS33]|uniref:phosphonate C-P lyase system protein PhnH n=1 Tax=Hydrogenophaga sp. BPS33 TaxID=2651974 RepID=UPI00131FD0DB|nr:phosphonate C-P lyase system protein PhnH [Hydrogenophaga sp. BPS33]QHE83533.1 phosphonate C-P lyase system protein PhnH [Hydrogenophaga sp. BPS33]
MNATDLQHIVGGFEHEAFGSQAAFRAAMNALSYPGRWAAMPMQAERPRQGHGAAAVLLLALLDADCTVWLSPKLAASDAAPWLRFHTGCQLVAEAGAAQFVWVARGDAMPALARLVGGSDNQPDHSTTCVLDVLAQDGGAWTLSGPGIPGTADLSVDGLPGDFAAQWVDNHAAFPRGVDVFLCTPSHVAGLPRTTRIGAAAPQHTEEA